MPKNRAPRKNKCDKCKLIVKRGLPHIWHGTREGRMFPYFSAAPVPVAAMVSAMKNKKKPPPRKWHDYQWI